MSEIELSLQKYFKERIHECVLQRKVDFAEKEGDQKYWKLIAGIENDLRKRLHEADALVNEFGFLARPSFLDRWLKELPKKDVNEVMVEWLEAENRATNIKIDYRICVEILFAIDVFEKHDMQLDWLKGFLDRSEGELHRWLKEKNPYFNAHPVRLPSINIFGSTLPEERNRWLTSLRSTLEKSLFLSEGTQPKVDKDDYKLRVRQFYEELRRLPEYDLELFNTGVHRKCEIDILEIYTDKLKPPKLLSDKESKARSRLWLKRLSEIVNERSLGFEIIVRETD